MMTYNLSDFLPDSDTVTIVVKHPKTQEPVGWEVELLLSHTPEFKELQYGVLARVPRTEDGSVSPMDAARLTVELYAKRIKSWTVTDQGKVIPLDRAEEVLNKLPWLTRQIQEGVEEAEDFI